MPLNTNSDSLRTKAWAALSSGRYEEAEALYAAAVHADPESADAHHDLGGFYQYIGRPDAAEPSLRTAYSLAPQNPQTRHALGFVLMTLGAYREGWPLYDARHEIPELGVHKPSLPFAEWRGEPVDGKRLLIFPEQGLGDQIQYARFASWMTGQGADVTLLCHPALTELFDQSLAAKVISASGAVEFEDPDYWVMSGSVTGRAGLEPATLPNAPYLRASGGGAPRQATIGVVAQGNLFHPKLAHRSLPPDAAGALLSLPGTMSLHPDDTGAQDFAATAAIVDQLDLVISVDTSVVHLAAAMGKPTWILLPRIMTDWRWMSDRTDSPWYPTARLFRQPAPGDWDSVIADVRAALAG